MTKTKIALLALLAAGGANAAGKLTICLTERDCFEVPQWMNKIPITWPGPYHGFKGLELRALNRLQRQAAAAGEGLSQVQTAMAELAQQVVREHGDALVDLNGQWMLARTTSAGEEVMQKLNAYDPTPTPWQPMGEPEPDPWFAKGPEPTPWMITEQLDAQAQMELLILNQMHIDAEVLPTDHPVHEVLQGALQTWQDVHGVEARFD